jgi:hypothetical protein
MDVADLLTDGFTRVHEAVHAVLRGLTPDDLALRTDPAANTIGWLVWHLTRVQDDHVADAFGTEQVWTRDGWHPRFGLPFGVRATGYGQKPDEVGAVRVGADLLAGYHDAVHERTVAHLAALSPADLDRIVDERWDPPVSLGVRLVSVISDDLQHVGQAAFVRGVLDRRR